MCPCLARGVLFNTAESKNNESNFAQHHHKDPTGSGFILQWPSWTLCSVQRLVYSEGLTLFQSFSHTCARMHSAGLSQHRPRVFSSAAYELQPVLLGFDFKFSLGLRPHEGNTTALDNLCTKTTKRCVLNVWQQHTLRWKQGPQYKVQWPRTTRSSLNPLLSCPHLYLRPTGLKCALCNVTLFRFSQNIKTTCMTGSRRHQNSSRGNGSFTPERTGLVVLHPSDVCTGFKEFVNPEMRSFLFPEWGLT